MRVPPRLLACLTILMTIPLSCLSLAPAQAQTPPIGGEKRIALVVGNAAYQAGALATPANDAGLVAQTLQAAGFDVVGARDLDEDSLRRAMRDFTDKAAASGPDTIAFVYLAGYGLQLNGENYFAPIDAKIGSAQDVPVQALRISDYKRRLAALPLKARFVVLDAGRTTPFVKSGDPLAGGLALTEAEPGTLVAFNAAPGTVGPDEKGPYGAYAQGLVEMIREGGLNPAELFDRVRLRVSETTKGAEVPWNVSKIEIPFVFFQRAADAPPVDDPGKVAALRSRPIRDLGARDAYTACLQRDTIQSYQDFVSAYPSDAMAKRVRVLIAARREALTWRRTYLADNPDGYWSYLSRYPRGPHAWDARRRLRELSVALAPPPHFAYLDYDLPPPPPEEIVYVERPAVYFADPYYDLPPPPPPPVYFLPPPPAYIVDLAPPPPVTVAYALPIPAFVPVPAYVVPPPSIAPPPNNVYFQNIHNTSVINEINRQTIIQAQNPQGPHGPSIGAVGAGAVAGAALGAAVAHVALPPSVAQKAVLPPNGGPNGVGPAGGPPGGTGLRPGQFGGPTPLSGQAAGPGQPAPGTPGARPAIGQPLPGQNGLPLPQQANRPGQPGQVSPGNPAGRAVPGQNGLPQQADRPSQPGLGAPPPNRPAVGQQLPGPNGQPLPVQANRPGQPAAGNPAASGPTPPGPNGQPQQANRPGRPGAGSPAQANRPEQPPGGPTPDAARQQAIQARQAAQQRAAEQAQRQQANQQRATEQAQQRAAAQAQQAQQRQMQQQQAAQQQRAAAQAQQAQQRQMMQQQQAAQAAQQRAAAQSQQRQMMQQQQAAQMAQQRAAMQSQQRQMMAAPPRPQPQAPPPRGGGGGNGGCHPGLPCR